MTKEHFKNVQPVKSGQADKSAGARFFEHVYNAGFNDVEPTMAFVTLGEAVREVIERLAKKMEQNNK